MGARVNAIGSRQPAVRSWRAVAKGCVWTPASCLLLLLSGCAPEAAPKQEVPKPAPVQMPPAPPFDADSAYAFVAKQVAFGPRVPGTPSHAACADWIVARLKASGATVTEQRGTVTAFNGNPLPLRNIIGSWRPEARDRILLLAHYDTRPFADKDEERRNEPILGANDGGSGVGILLEIARHLGAATDTALLGVDLLFTDVEDYGEPTGAMTMDGNSIATWALGSQYWAKNPHVPGYTARFGVLLDMCGAKDARFYQESISMQYAPQVVRKLWRTAAALGHGDRFVAETRHFVGTDDHLPINELLRIPTADIIEYHEGTRAFHPSWHTHDDDMDVIDRATLQAVGTTVMEVLWKER
ncbi:MAG: M28 family peptidase [Flavobacteriales bacterium]|nr:M28 family peptidase [Flavobacteriales bacterium]